MQRRLQFSPSEQRRRFASIDPLGANSIEYTD